MRTATGLTPDDNLTFGFGESGKQAGESFPPCETTAAASARKIPFPLRKINVKSLHSTIHEEMPVISAVIYILTVSFAAYAIYKVQAK